MKRMEIGAKHMTMTKKPTKKVGKTMTWSYKGFAYIRPVGRGIIVGKNMNDLADILEAKFGSGDVMIEVLVTPVPRTK